MSSSLPPSALAAYRVAWRRACAIVVAASPCPASKGVHQDREIKISMATFFKTWCLNKGGGPFTIIPPEGIRKIRDIWSGKIKICDLQESLLVRNVEIEPCGKLSEATCKIASKLRYPHHQRA